MITVKYHYNFMDDQHMKCTDVFLNNNDFEAWYERYKDQIKNVYVIGKTKIFG
jgi:hypothetical protein